jgi:hypothetical protein
VHEMVQNRARIFIVEIISSRTSFTVKAYGIKHLSFAVIRAFLLRIRIAISHFEK